MSPPARFSTLSRRYLKGRWMAGYRTPVPPGLGNTTAVYVTGRQRLWCQCFVQPGERGAGLRADEDRLATATTWHGPRPALLRRGVGVLSRTTTPGQVTLGRETTGVVFLQQYISLTVSFHWLEFELWKQRHHACFGKLIGLIICESLRIFHSLVVIYLVAWSIPRAKGEYIFAHEIISQRFNERKLFAFIHDILFLVNVFVLCDFFLFVVHFRVFQPQ